jgi:hypothetical protein
LLEAKNYNSVRRSIFDHMALLCGHNEADACFVPLSAIVCNLC